MIGPKTLPAILLSGLLATGTASATNGYFSHGYGVKSLGIAGIGIALPQDGLAAATNPAGTAFVGERADLGLTLFQPKRGAVIDGNAGPGGSSLNGSYEGNGTGNFLIPELGYVRQLNSRWAAGVAVYGNGGMNTDYAINPWSGFGATGAAGVNLEQLFISPSVAYKINDDHALGLAVNLAYQRFAAKGIALFAGNGASESPGNFSNQGSDSAIGWGLRIGYTGRLTPELTVGATYTTRTEMARFDKYRGLFAEQGGFDIPASYGVGIAWRATSALTLAADVQRIEYAGVKSVGNSLFAGSQFGSSDGPGFGWRNVAVVKLGASYDLSPALQLRGGYSHVGQPIPAGEVLLNILAPGVVQDHLTVGATWKRGKHGELSFYFNHAFRKTVDGPIPLNYGGGVASLHLAENSVGIGYGWRY